MSWSREGSIQGRFKTVNNLDRIFGFFSVERGNSNAVRGVEFDLACPLVHPYRAVHPPSMRIVSPVIRDAALEARNTTAPATSIGSPMRCNAAMRSITSERNSGFARAPSVPGVRINVGATAFTV